MDILKKKRFYLSVFLVMGILTIIFILKAYSKPAEILSQVATTVAKQGLKTDSDGRTNILIVGLDGRIDPNSTENGGLTDSIMLISFDKTSKTYTMFSFPRDIWITSDLKTNINYVGKINNIYKDYGMKGLLDVMQSLSGKEIHYYLGVSFEGFIEAIDTLGGIDVKVENSFDDYMYPIEGLENDTCEIPEAKISKVNKELQLQKECVDNNDCRIFETTEDLESEVSQIRKDLENEFSKENSDLKEDSDKYKKELDEYVSDNLEKIEDTYRYDGKILRVKVEELVFECRFEHIRFDQGVQGMDGETALKYARSRQALGPEGSDFARARRQQQVIDAVKSKVLSIGVLANPAKLSDLYNTYKKNIETNASLVDVQGILGNITTLENKNSSVITSGNNYNEGGILKELYGDAEYDFAFVLVPENNDYGIFRSFISEMLRVGEVNEEDNIR